ncbi:MAG: DUF1189 family protein [Gammaproteobacteria bacterium]|nr:DUF1189 family protein [Gammaproteobacteria bacterium]
MKYNFLQALYMSFYSRDFYREVGQRWGARAILYLLFVVALCWIPATYVIQSFINKNLPSTMTKFIDQVPPMTIKKGIAETPEYHPYFIVDPETKKIVGIIDTTGKYKSLDNTPAFFLMTNDKIIYLTKDQGVKIHKFDTNLNMDIVPQVIKQKVISFSSWLWIVIFSFCVVFSFCWRLLQAVFYSLFGLMYGAVADTRVGYSTIWLLALVAITPVIIINTILFLSHIIFPHEWIFTFVLAMIYLCFAINANKNEAQQ